MNVLIVFIGMMMLAGTRAASRGRANRAWPVFVVASLVMMAFLSQRAY